MNNYTSYFNKLNVLPSGVIPIAICEKSPDWYTGLEYKKLAPSWNIYSEWKYIHHDDSIYVDRFNNEILSKLNPLEIFNELKSLVKNKSFALVCYESSDKFCHRHIVSNWMNRSIPIIDKIVEF